MISSFMTLTFLFVFFPRAKSRFHGEIEENYQTQYSRNETEMLLLFLFSIFFEIMGNVGEIVKQRKFIWKEEACKELRS